MLNPRRFATLVLLALPFSVLNAQSTKAELFGIVRDHSTWILGTTVIDLQWWYIKDSRMSGGFTAGLDITYEWRRTAADKL